MAWRETILIGAGMLAFFVLIGFIAWDTYREKTDLRTDCLRTGGVLVEGSCVRCP